MSFRVDVLSIFPELFGPFFQKGLLGHAAQSGLISHIITNPRDFTSDPHRSVDDRPYGGGDGMIMRAEPLLQALKNVKSPTDVRPVIYLSPQGQTLTDSLARELSLGEGLIMICGRYGGVDERFLALEGVQELSVGDYVLNGGEVAAMCLIEAVSRFVPGVLGNEESPQADSFSNGLLEAPQMTRPSEFCGLKVPAVLLSGDHKAIAQWRRDLSILRTYFRRPTLFEQANLSKEEIAKAFECYMGLSSDERKMCGLPPTH